MLANKIYVKKLHSIDTASNLTHVFIGKTGTLTKSELNVSFVITGEANIYENFCGLCNELRKEIIIGAGVNNDAIIIDNKKVIGSNNIDRALLSYLAIENNVKINPNIVECSKPFNSAKKYSSIITRNSTKYMKGDPEVLLKSCDSYIDDSGNEKNFTSEVLSKLKKI